MAWSNSPMIANDSISRINIPQVSISIWKELYEAARMFREIKCWNWMWDSDADFIYTTTLLFPLFLCRPLCPSQGFSIAQRKAFCLYDSPPPNSRA